VLSFLPVARLLASSYIMPWQAKAGCAEHHRSAVERIVNLLPSEWLSAPKSGELFDSLTSATTCSAPPLTRHFAPTRFVSTTLHVNPLFSTNYLSNNPMVWTKRLVPSGYWIKADLRILTKLRGPQALQGQPFRIDTPANNLSANMRIKQSD
jgi:hypothetical protein